MNKYLEKMAVEETKKSDPLAVHKAIVTGGVGSLLAIKAHPYAVGPFADAANRKLTSSENPIQWKAAKGFMRHHGLSGRVKINARDPGTARYADYGATYSRMTDSFDHGLPHGVGQVLGIRGKEFSNRGFHSVMHELGHAVDLDARGNRLKNLLTHARSPKASLVTAGLGLTALSGEDTRKYAPAAVLPVALSMLREEAAANYHAAKYLHKHGPKGSGLKYLKHSLPAMGTYVASPAVFAGGLYLSGKMMDAWQKKPTEK